MDEAKNTEKLKGLVTDMVQGGIKTVQEEQAKLRDEVQSKLDVTNNKLDEVLKASERLVKVDGQDGKPDQELVYKNFYLPEQGRVDGVTFKDEATKNAMTKMMIDVLELGMSGRQNINFDYVKNTTVSSTLADDAIFMQFVSTLKSLGEIYGVMMANADVQMMNSDTLHLVVDADPTITTAYKAEGTAYDDGVPADILDSVEITAKDIGAYGILSNQAIEDASLDLLGFLLPKFAASLSRLIDAGTLVTAGSLTGFTNLVDHASIQDSTGTLDVAHILDAYSKLDRRMKGPGLKLYFHRLVYYGTVLNNFTNLAGTANNPQAALMESLWNIPVVDTEDLNYTLTNDYIVGLLGNMKQAYTIGMRKNAGSFFINPYSLDTKRQTRITFHSRMCGAPTIPKAMVRLIY